MSHNFKDCDWTVGVDNYTNKTSYEGAQLAVLQDIRAELRTIRQRLNCPRFMGIPYTLDAIKRNTAKPKKRRKK